MKCDYFLCERNEKMEKEAKSLGFKAFFVKEISKAEEIQKEEKEKYKQEYDAVLIKTDCEEELRRIIDKASNYFSLIFVLGVTDVINRIALESKKVKALVSPEYQRKYDYTDRRNSGLNHILCKIAAQNKKAIIINFKEILAKKRQDQAKLIGRIMQNVRLCRKYKVEVRIASFASKLAEIKTAHTLKSFFAVLGCSTQQLKKVLDPLLPLPST